MNDNQKYFIHLLDSHINNKTPNPKPNNVSWKELFLLGESHNLTGMLCLAIKSLPKNQQPSKAMTYFNQALGQTLQSYETKNICNNLICDTFNNNEIKHLFVKGSALRELYPTPAVRTSGDIDVIVEKDDLHKAGQLLSNLEFEVDQKNDLQYVFFYKKQEIELKNYLDHVIGISKNRFDHNFDNAHKVNDFTYRLDDTYHLFYVISHMLSHIKYGGAGIRQLMDIHILITKTNINFDELLRLLKEIKLYKSGITLIKLSSQFFSTNIPFDNFIDKELYEHLTEIILNGGVFGFKNGNLGTVRLALTNDKNNNTSSIKALFGMFIVSKEYLFRTYNYANKHHILLPIAYINRLFDAVFKRGKQNKKYIESIFKDKESAIKIAELNKELEI